jgi:antitoxin VapB
MDRGVHADGPVQGLLRSPRLGDVAQPELTSTASRGTITSFICQIAIAGIGVYTFCIYGEVTMATARVFKHGNSQAVRLPKEFRVEVKELEISKVGNVITLRPKKLAYEDVVAAFAGFRGRIKREKHAEPKRNWKP